MQASLGGGGGGGCVTAAKLSGMLQKGMYVSPRDTICLTIWPTILISISQLEDFKTLVVSILKHLLGYIMLIQLEEKILDILWTLVLDRGMPNELDKQYLSCFSSDESHNWVME